MTFSIVILVWISLVAIFFKNVRYEYDNDKEIVKNILRMGDHLKISLLFFFAGLILIGMTLFLYLSPGFGLYPSGWEFVAWPATFAVAGAFHIVVGPFYIVKLFRWRAKLSRILW